MATSVNDPRITAAINKAHSWANSQVGRANARSIWGYVYPQWTNTGYAWCGGFTAAAYKQAGVNLLNCAWWFYTPYIKNFAVKIGAWKPSRGSGVLGDNVLYDWQNDGVIDHVGLSWPDPKSSLYRAIEGNTSSNASGSQGNGGQCAIKYRSCPPIKGWVNMRKVLAWMIDNGKWDGKTTGTTTSSGSTPTITLKKNTTDGNYLLDEDGDRGPTTNARWQQVMGTPIDGRIDKPSKCVMQFQKFLNSVVSSKWQQTLNKENALRADGYLGIKTWKVFQYWFADKYPDQMKVICGFTRSSNNNRFWGEWCDGNEGRWTQKALQWVLNRSWYSTGALGTSKKFSGTTSTAKPTTPSTPNTTPSTAKAPDGKALLDVDGSRGTLTINRWQQVMGTTIDGRIDKPSLCIKQFQRFLNTQVSRGDIRNLTGKYALDIDGLAGPATWKVFQYWFANKYPDQMKSICGFTIQSNLKRFWNEWTNGVDGPWTYKSLQWILNRSYAGSGKLGSK